MIRRANQQAKAAADAARAAAAEAAARAKKEAQEAQAKAVAVILDNLTVEDTSLGTLPITDEDREEARIIIERFTSSMHFGYYLTKLERCYNRKLEERYAAAKERFRVAKKPLEDDVMFHGTAAPNVDKYRIPVSL